MTSSITPEEEKTLQKELPTYLEQHGANNKSKAKYVKLISDNVIGSKNPKFFSMQPRVKNHNNIDAWKAAYHVIFNFFDEFNDDLTKEVLLNELKQNKIQKPPSPSLPDYSKTDDLNEFFSFESIFEVANNNTFQDNVEEFVAQHPQDTIAIPSANTPNKNAAPKPASPVNQNSGAFLTQPNTQNRANKSPVKGDDNVENEDEDVIDIVDDFNDYSENEAGDQAKKDENVEIESKNDDENPEVFDINDITDSDAENENKKNDDAADDVIDDVEDFNDDDDVIDIEDNDSNDHKQQNSESDAQNSNMSISINSDMFEMNFDE